MYVDLDKRMATFAGIDTRRMKTKARRKSWLPDDELRERWRFNAWSLKQRRKTGQFLPTK